MSFLVGFPVVILMVIILWTNPLTCLIIGVLITLAVCVFFLSQLLGDAVVGACKYLRRK